MMTKSGLGATGWCYRTLLILLLFIPVSVFAQTPPSADPSPQPQVSPTPTLERRFFKNILQDQKAIWTFPFRLRGEDARWVLPFGVSTAALIATDSRTAGEVREFDDQFVASRDASRIGAFETTGGLSLAFYFIGRARKDRRLKETGLLGAEALIDGTIVSETLKAVTQRPRPLQDQGRGRFFRGGSSFPSGHAISAWSFATVVANEYSNNRLIKFSAYGLATAVSISRYTGERHFLSDIFVGSVIGYGIGNYVYRTHHDPNLDSGDSQSGQSKRSKLFPLIVPDYDRREREYGITLSWSF